MVSWDNLEGKLKSITTKTLLYGFEERPGKLREVWMGWVDKHRLANIHTKLKAIDEWLRNRLRYCIWSTSWRRKKLERKRKNLIRLGVPQGQAFAWSRTKLGGWAVAQSPILGTTVTLSRLRRKDYQVWAITLSRNSGFNEPLYTRPLQSVPVAKRFGVRRCETCPTFGGGALRQSSLAEPSTRCVLRKL